MHLRRSAAVTLLAGAALVACGSDKEKTKTTPPAPTTTAVKVVSAGAPIVVTASDYSFAGLPLNAPPGTKLALHNASTKEVHEMVVVRLPDNVKEPVAELLKLPEEELNKRVPDTEPATVIVALPGKDGQAVEGDGTLTQPGRYAVVCFIPVGADPSLVEKAMAAPPGTGEEPDLGDGPPHFTKGMSGEITIS
jgi:hypothetical protein